jgi:hypothetical protein
MSQYSPHNALPLFATERPPHSTPKQATRFDTQDEAYALAISGQVARILAYITSTPSTCDEVEVALGMTHQSCSAAINKLMRERRVVAGGNRKTRSNRNARVWSATQPTENIW